MAISSLLTAAACCSVAVAVVVTLWVVFVAHTWAHRQGPNAVHAGHTR